MTMALIIAIMIGRSMAVRGMLIVARSLRWLETPPTLVIGARRCGRRRCPRSRVRRRADLEG
jgi:hypothetical protein